MFESCRQILTTLLKEEGSANANLIRRFAEIFSCGLNENNCEHAKVCRQFLEGYADNAEPVVDKKSEPQEHSISISKTGTSL